MESQSPLKDSQCLQAVVHHWGQVPIAQHNQSKISGAAFLANFKTLENEAGFVKVEPGSNSTSNDEVEKGSCCDHQICWWSPPQDSFLVTVCTESSIKGLHCMGQAKLHLSERLFWLFAFLFSVTAATILIFRLWSRYIQTPVIVSFQGNEQSVDSLPFPAATICNINMFSKKVVNELEDILKMPNHTLWEQAKKNMTYVRNICNTQQSFSKGFGFASGRGTFFGNEASQRIPGADHKQMMDFLLEVHPFLQKLGGDDKPIEQKYGLDEFGKELMNCSNLFQPTMTDYGMCCVFNILPMPLLFRNFEVDPIPKSRSTTHLYWSSEELQLWQLWNYDKGFVLSDKLQRPRRQKRGGLASGLSILVDPHLDDFFCPISDSEGLRYVLHTPLEIPRVNDFASVAELGKEVLIEVHPDLINSDYDIRDYKPEKRQCSFGKEKDLTFFSPYTGGNCVDDCIAKIMGERCNCTLLHMPREVGMDICNNEPNSSDYKCAEDVQNHLQDTLQKHCQNCDVLCDNIAYNYETTIVNLQNASSLWGDPNNGSKPHWAHNKMSILHIFFGAESIVPKLRKRVYGRVDLIANTGGILGICLGFSILSGAEIIYFLTIRAFWKNCRRRMIRRRMKNRLGKLFKADHSKERIIRVNPNTVALHPSRFK